MTEIRSGLCNRCGKCCEGYRRLMTEAEKLAAMNQPEIEFRLNLLKCPQLSWDGALAVCDLGDNKPQECKDYPVCADDIKNIPECSYSFA